MIPQVVLLGRWFRLMFKVKPVISLQTLFDLKLKY